MLNVFTLASGRLAQEEIDNPAELANLQPIWVDLEAPTPEEKGWIAGRFGLTIPQDAVDDDLEESARFYEEVNGELHIRSDFLIEGDDDKPSRNVRVAFILHQNVLFSVHSEDLPVFRLLRLRARRIPALIEDAKDVLLKLYDADAEYSADALEGIYDPGTREVTDNYFRNAGVPPVSLNIVIELGSPEAIKGVVETGIGFAIVSRASVAKEKRLGDLLAIPLKPSLTRTLSMVYPKEKFRSRLVTAFVDFAAKKLPTRQGA